MWLFTEHGFFSVVRADPEKVKGIPADVPHVMVRARVESDLDNVRAAWSKHNQGEAPEILRWKGRDYPARLIMPQAEWVQILSSMSEDIDYSNFKSRVGKTQGKERANLYLDVWSTMNNAASKLKKAKAKLASYLHKTRGKRSKGRVSRETQSSLERWFERHDYTPGEHGVMWEDDVPMPTEEHLARTELPEGTDRVTSDPFHLEEEPEQNEVEVLYEELRAFND
jgi:hypothetical protein